MIHDVDETLRALVRRDVTGGNGSNVDVAFEAPTTEWASKRQGPTLNLYLYDIREDLERRRVQFEEVRDDEGRVIERKMPPRKFKLSYLVTAWTTRPEDEHRLLSAALAALVSFDAVPRDLLEGGLADLGEDIRMTVALPPPQDRALSDVWTALGGELKPSLDLVITAPVAPLAAREQPIGPLVVEEPRIGLVGADGSVETAGGTGRAGKRRGAAAAGAPDMEVVEPIVETIDAGKPGTTGGRRVVMRTIPRTDD